jgi:hypothetical protein
MIGVMKAAYDPKGVIVGDGILQSPVLSGWEIAAGDLFSL